MQMQPAYESTLEFLTTLASDKLAEFPELTREQSLAAALLDVCEDLGAYTHESKCAIVSAMRRYADDAHDETL